jgi:hypothetical protein
VVVLVSRTSPSELLTLRLANRAVGPGKDKGLEAGRDGEGYVFSGE